jgi:hypothetical protein
MRNDEEGQGERGKESGGEVGKPEGRNWKILLIRG